MCFISLFSRHTCLSGLFTSPFSLLRLPLFLLPSSSSLSLLSSSVLLPPFSPFLSSISFHFIPRTSFLSFDMADGTILAPVGLQNMGNTCYLNSLLQLLSRVEPLCKTLLGAAQRSDSHCAVENGLRALAETMDQMRTRVSDRPLTPTTLLAFVWKRFFPSGTQQDPAELFCLLLECAREGIVVSTMSMAKQFWY